MSKTEIPSIRFRGFDDAWEQRKLGECFSERVESMPDGELISVTINDGIKKFFELGRHDNSNDNKSKYKKVCVGDIAYNSMRMWQGASGYSPYEGIVSPAYTVLSPNAGVFSRCIAYQFKLPQMIHTFQINSQGITSDNWNLKYPTLSEIEIYISKNVAEQKQIAEFFTSLDNLITLHQRKFEKLTNVKKSMLKKMFPQNGSSYPEIRFKGFTDPWEQRKAIDIADYSKGNGYSKGDLTDAGTPIILYGRLYTKYQFAISEVDTFAVPRNGAVYSQGNEVIVPASGETAEDIARASAVEKSGVLLGGDLNILRPFDFINPLFLALAISNGEPQKELAKKAQGKSVVHIHNTDIQEVTIAYPSRTEQDRIVSVFRQLDHLITLHQRELEKLQSIKKALLEKMFV